MGLTVSAFHPVGASFERHGQRYRGVITAEGLMVIMNTAENDDDRKATELDETDVASEETIDLTAPMRHFHRTIERRTLSSGPLANPRRTRLS
jgi:hypothetical protein